MNGFRSLAETEDPVGDGELIAEQVVVIGSRENGYSIPSTNVLGLSIETTKLPASISVLSDDLLEDLGARDLNSIITFVPGLANADNGGAGTENFLIRGFPQTQTFVNGIRQSTFAEGIRAIDTIERVQVLKGPSGVEAGLASPGGFVNIITKKPEDEFSAEVYVSAGDFGFFRAGGDVTGTVIEERVTSRVIAAYENKQWWRDGQDDRPILTIAPSFSVSLLDSTDLLLEYEYVDQDDPLDRGVIYIEGAGLEGNFLPRTFSFHGDQDTLEAITHRFDASLSHEFNRALSARVYYQRIDQETTESSFRNADSEGDGALFQSDGLTFSGNSVIDVFFADFGAEYETETLQLDLTAEFRSGSVGHFLSVGGAMARNENVFTDNDRDFVYGDYLDSLDVFDPINNRPPTLRDQFVAPNFVLGDEIGSIFAQWIAEWSPRIRTVGSIRFDDISFFEREDIAGISPDALAQLQLNAGPDPVELFSDGYDDEIVSFRVGGSVDLTSRLTSFVGYSEAGEPQNGFTRSGSAVDPVMSSAIETGLKWKIGEDNALVTISVYHLERSGIALSDPSNLPMENFLLPLGSAEISGLEVEAIGKFATDLSVFGGVSIQDSKITASDQDVVGNRFANTPDLQASAFATWNGSSFSLPQVDASVGLVYQGDRAANSGNDYQLPSYFRLDFAIGYIFENDVELRLNIENALDETYYTAAQDSIFGADQVAVGDRRLFQLTATKRF